MARGIDNREKDNNGRDFGSKSTTLEAVGMLLPFVAFPDKIRGKRIHFKIDNIAVVFGWPSGFVKEDETASEILKAVHYLGGAYGVTVTVQHVGRISDGLSTLADELSRKNATTNQTAAMAMMKAEERVVGGVAVKLAVQPSDRGRALQKATG